MMKRFYAGLASISFVASAWGMHNLSPKEQLFHATAPIDIHSVEGFVKMPRELALQMSRKPTTHSAPTQSYVPTSTTSTKSRNSSSPRSKSTLISQADSDKLIQQKLEEAEKAKAAAAFRQALASAKLSVSIEFSGSNSEFNQTFTLTPKESTEQKS